MPHKEWYSHALPCTYCTHAFIPVCLRPPFGLGFYPHKRTLLGTLRLRLCCRASSPIRRADSGVVDMLTDTDWPTVLEPGDRVSPWCWQLAGHSLVSRLAAFLFGRPEDSLFFQNVAVAFFFCACTLER